MYIDFFVYVCPECKKKTEYYPNPSYFHTCENCGNKTTYSKLIQLIDPDLIETEISRLKKLLTEYPTLESFFEKKKSFAEGYEKTKESTKEIIKNLNNAPKKTSKK